MQDLMCDDCSLMNNENSTTVKAIDPCSLAASNVAYHVTDNTGSEHKPNEHNNNNNNKYNGSVLRGVKLQETQEHHDLVGDYFKSQTPEANKSETLPTSWPQTSSMLNRVGSGTRITTTETHQYPSSHQHLLDNFQFTHTLNHNQTHAHHHQLLLHGSDDPLISHGADSVINDDDHSVEFKHLLTAVTNGEKRQQQQKQRLETDHHHYQHQHPKFHQSNPKQLLTQQSRLLSTASASGLVQKRSQNGCSSITKQQLKVKAGLMSAAQQQQQLKQIPYNAPSAVSNRTNPTNKAKPKAKKKTLNSINASAGSGTVKLRFHHQALPPQYLSHYEATQRRSRQNISVATTCGKAGTSSAAVKVTQTAKLPPPKSSHENVRSWLQKIAEIQRTAQLQQQQQPSKQEINNNTSSSEIAIQRIPSAVQHDANNNHQSCLMSESHSPATLLPDKTLRPNISSSTTTRKMKYADLPYMGEITLNNSKPRRGRKPKKADICHLIYKNYGTIFPDIPKNSVGSPQAAEMASFQLESREQISTENEEPLNLCLRDYQSLDLYSVSSGEGNGDAAEDIGANDDDEITDSGDTNSNCTTPGDALTDSMLATNMKTSMPCLEEVDERKPIKKEHTDEPTNFLLHPVRAYYQRLLESGMLLKQNDDGSTSTIAGFAGLPIETIEKDNQIALKIPIPSGFFVASKVDTKITNPLIQSIDYPEPLSTPSSIKSEQSFSTTTTSSNVTGSIGCNGINTQSNATPQKRKRSAIFIPPMPAENTSNPANEVSICKFKFTGGIKPTLQEKKMLSVDSDGNYRYYSGTGDKSMRGYEFFPRESLQQSGFLPGVGGAGAFLNATGEKVSTDIPPPSADLSNELLQIPDSPTGTLLLDSAAAVTVQSSHSPLTSVALSNHDELSQGNKRTAINSYDNSVEVQPNVATFHRKKKSQSSLRRTTQREKLERTFKEKGFLIQTQQLESAEGATYCKFRQLKKFTRYLFRNWKDYLPDGQLLKSQGLTDAANQQAAIESLLADHGFDSRDVALEQNTELECAAEILSTDVLPGVERV